MEFFVSHVYDDPNGPWPVRNYVLRIFIAKYERQ
ncbi:MAG: hypothetical protein UX65_C0001G0077 [Parcubacteria group bacterium GW2011_GWB1_46_8]|nr:MAG: hypothetical protein UX14_C0020G0015 [Parcubacteria group bacterium GW2011_GWF1_45_5]KKU46683.1 MAG: hypothetical protein UX65_C0001G0077 [Parcubacteria group bacterium GW2011_GWB1_46_8]